MGSVGRRNNNSLELTPEHDVLTIWLHQNYLEVVNRELQIELGPSARIDLEPCMEGSPILFPDAIIRGGDESKYAVAVEIKPRITSLGSTLRQTKLYHRRLRAREIFAIVVTHTNDYDALLLQQHIHVIHPPEGVGDPQSRMNLLEVEV